MEAALSVKKVAWDEAGGKVQIIQGLVSHIRNFGTYPKRYWRILSRKMTHQFRSFKIILTAVCALLSCLHCVRLFAIPRTVAHQVPLSMGILQVRILEWVAIREWYLCYSVAKSCLTLQPQGLQHTRIPCLFPGLLKLMFMDSVIPSNHFILCCPLLLLPSIFPSIRVSSLVAQTVK